GGGDGGNEGAEGEGEPEGQRAEAGAEGHVVTSGHYGLLLGRIHVEVFLTTEDTLESTRKITVLFSGSVITGMIARWRTPPSPPRPRAPRCASGLTSSSSWCWAPSR